MITKHELLNMVTGLKRVGNLAIINDPMVLAETCLSTEIPLVLNIASIIAELFDHFDYAESPEFLASIQGKSEAVKQMRIKLLNPVKRTELRNRLGDALAGILEKDDAFNLVPTRQYCRLHELRKLLREISNPDSKEDEGLAS